MNTAFANWLHRDLLGWKIRGQFPKNLKKAIIVVGPHTSNWDFFHGFIVRSQEKFQSNFMIKEDWLNKPIIGSWMRKSGAVGVVRSKNMKLTDQIANYFNTRDQFVIAITPEGTRKYNPKWKTGFWYIAKQAKVPLIPVSFNYPTKEVIWQEAFHLSDDMDADIEKLKSIFRQYEGKNPELGVL